MSKTSNFPGIQKYFQTSGWKKINQAALTIKCIWISKQCLNEKQQESVSSSSSSKPIYIYIYKCWGFIRWGSFSVFLQPFSLWNTTMCHRSLCWQHAPAFIPSSFSFCHSRLSCTALPHRILLQISLPSASLASLICCSVIAFQGQIYKSTSLCPFGSPWFHFMVSIPLFWSFAYGLLFIIICLSGS